jgi:hypothetical protein
MISSLLKPQTPLNFPEFQKHLQLGVANAYTFESIDSRIWYQTFIGSMQDALATKIYFPIYRMGDGEYSFAAGNYLDLTPWTRLTIKEVIKKALRLALKKRKLHRSGYLEVGYESYSDHEYDEAKKIFVESLKIVAHKGYLALGLDDSALYRRHFPYIIDWFERNCIPFHKNNYIHVYAVYALLRSTENNWLFVGKKILVLSGFVENPANVKKYLIHRGAKVADIQVISKTKSMFDVIDVSAVEHKYDVIFISAGVGAVNILAQLQTTKALCIDIGFILRIWSNEDLQWDRPFCVPDCHFDRNKVRFL